MADRPTFAASRNGFPAVLVRLPAIERDELEELIIDAWHCMEPRKLVAEYDTRANE